MRQLVWKEFREKRLWFVPLLGSTLGVVAFGSPYVFWDCIDWVNPSIVVALLSGGATYSGEIGNGTVEFLYSRGVSWKRVLAAKLAAGFGMLLAAAVVSAVVFRLTAPAPYVRFAGLGCLLNGVAIALLFTGAPYVLGAACSTVLPGIFGSILVLAASVGAGIGLGLGFGHILLAYAPERFHRLYNYGSSFAPFALGAVCLGTILAAVLTARFGLSLPTGKRAARYAFVVLVVGASLGPLDPFIQAPFALQKRWRTSYSVSSSGEYAFGDGYKMVQPGNIQLKRYTMVRLSDGKTAVLPWPVGFEFQGWVGPDTVVAVEHEPLPDAGDRFVLLKMKRSGALSETSIQLGRTCGLLLASPDAKLAAVSVNFSSPPLNGIIFVDISHGRKLDLVIRGLIPDSYWWQSNTEFGYLDEHRNRHIIRVR